MKFQFGLLLPLACALLYVFGALAVKRASSLGVGVWRTGFLSNWSIALLFVPVWIFQGGQLHAWTDYWQPATTALLFLGGQVLMFGALGTGDVSVTTPVMGTKVIMVALFSSLLHVGSVPLQWWIGAVLSTSAIVLLHLGEGSKHRRVGRTVSLAFCSAASFGLGDVFLQKWVPAWGPGSFFPPMFMLAALFSCAFVPMFSAPLTALDRRAWRWAAPAALVLALNNAGVVLSIGLVGSATAINIVYSLRGLFSVLLVWTIGHWFSSEERHLTGAVLRNRALGAGLMVAAIVLVLV